MARNTRGTWSPTSGGSARAALLPLLLLGAVRLPAQEAPAEPPSIDGLLRQLVAAPASAWDARVAAMRATVEKARGEAKARREQAKAKVVEAEMREQRATALDTEIEKLGKLREMLAALTFRDPAGQGEGAATEPGKLEVALAQLTAIPVAGWDVRVLAIRTAASAERELAKTLRGSAAELGSNADKDDASAIALEQQIERLAGLRELLGKLQIELIAGSVPAAPGRTAATPEAPKAAMPAAVEASAAKPPMSVPNATPVAAPPPASSVASPSVEPPAPAAVAAMTLPTDERLVTYDDDVFPIFEENCTTCHDPGDASGGLDLTTHAAALIGGGSGRTIRPGNADTSRLYLLVSHKEKPTMPPDEPRIDKELIETIRLWIAQGAPKDMARARALATERAEARAKAAAAAAMKATAKAESPVVMPTDLPPVEKAYPARPAALRAIAVSPAAPLVAVPGFGQVLLLHADELRELGVLAFPFGSVERLAFTADGARLLAAGGSPGRHGGAVLYDVRTGAELGRYGEQADTVLAADVAPDGALIAVGGTRRRVEVFAFDGTAVWQGAHDDWVTAVAFDPEGALLASADRAGNILVREAPNGRELHSLTGHEGLVTALVFAPDSGLLATAGQDRTVRAFKMSDGNQAWSQRVHDADVLCLSWGAEGGLLSAGADGRVVVWKSDGNREPDLPRRGEWVYGVAASVDGSRAFATDWLGRLCVLDLKTRKVSAERTPLAVAQ